MKKFTGEQIFNGFGAHEFSKDPSSPNRPIQYKVNLLFIKHLLHSVFRQGKSKK